MCASRSITNRRVIRMTPSSAIWRRRDVTNYRLLASRGTPPAPQQNAPVEGNANRPPEDEDQPGPQEPAEQKKNEVRVWHWLSAPFSSGKLRTITDTGQGQPLDTLLITGINELPPRPRVKDRGSYHDRPRGSPYLFASRRPADPPPAGGGGHAPFAGSSSPINPSTIAARSANVSRCHGRPYFSWLTAWTWARNTSSRLVSTCRSPALISTGP